MKRRNKVNPEFSMSSLTDIIFLLLIFFMLTSSTIQINVQIPESDSTTVAPSDMVVMMTSDKTLTFNGKRTSWAKLEKLIAKEVHYGGNKPNATVNIVSEVGVPWERVHKVIKIAAGLKIRAIIATQPRK